jgi:hypothetical protein
VSVPEPAPNKALEPTAYSVRSCVAPASGGGSCLACVPCMLSCSGVKVPCSRELRLTAK